MENMNENEKSLNESIEESSAPTYYKDVTPILRKNAIDHSIMTKVTEELKIKRLQMEHEEMDVQIAAIQKRIALEEKEGEELERQLHNVTELEKQAMRCFKRTGDMFTVLVEESDKLKSEFKSLEDRQLQFATKVEQLTSQEVKNQESKRKIESLEQQIRDVLNTPKPALDETLIRDNIQLRTKFKEQVQQLEAKLKKKRQNEELKDTKCRLLQEICIKQNRNKEFAERVTTKRQSSEENQRMLQAKFAQIQDKISSSTSIRDELLKDIKEAGERAKNITLQLISKKSQQLQMVQQQRAEMVDSLSVKQMALVNQQLKQAEQQSKLDNLSEKLETETREVEEWKVKKRNLDEQLQLRKKQLEDISMSFKERLAKASTDFKEKKDLLLKQHSLETANIEYLKLQLDENLKKIENAKKDLKRYDTLIKWEHMQYEFDKNRAAKLGIDVSALLGEQENTNNQISSYQEKTRVEEIEVIEIEDTLASGQKSPGILKSPHRNLQQQSDKHVTFEGLSSTESSSTGVAVPEGGGVNSELNEEAFNQLIKEWTTSGSSFNKRRNLDF